MTAQLLPPMLLLLAASPPAPSLAPGERWVYAISDQGASEPALLEVVIHGGAESRRAVVRVRASEELEVTAPPSQLLGAMATAASFKGPREAALLLVAAARLDALRRGPEDAPTGPWATSPSAEELSIGGPCEVSGRTGRLVTTRSGLAGGTSRPASRTTSSCPSP